MATGPSTSPTTVMPSSPTTEPIASVAFSARCRSAAWVMIGVATIRTSVGTAMTMPMVRASRPLRLEPEREKRQLDTAEKEIGGVEQPQFQREAIGGELGCRGHRSVCLAASIVQIGETLSQRTTEWPPSPNTARSCQARRRQASRADVGADAALILAALGRIEAAVRDERAALGEPAGGARRHGAGHRRRQGRGRFRKPPPRCSMSSSTASMR